MYEGHPALELVPKRPWQLLDKLQVPFLFRFCAFKARLQQLRACNLFKVPFLQLAINPDTDMAEAPHSLPKKVEKCPSAAPPQQHNDLPQFQLLEKDVYGSQRHVVPREDQRVSQGCSRAGPHSHSEHISCSQPGSFWGQSRLQSKPSKQLVARAGCPQELGGAQASSTGPSQPLRPSPMWWEGKHCSGEAAAVAALRVSPRLLQVPGFVRNMHQRLVSNGPPDEWLLMDILRLTEAHPTDVAVTLLRCAPSCDRGAAIMWKNIASSGTTLKKVLPTLLCVMEGWPLQKMYTSDGDTEDVFALAATRVLWEILRLPWCPEPFVEYFPNLFVALLFQVYLSTEQVSEDINALWKRCQEENRLPTNINRCHFPVLRSLPHPLGCSLGSQHDLGLCSAYRFVVNTVKALLHHLRCLDLLMAVERRCAWDTLLCADTHHYAVGLLAR
ncbi:uncharacterized protein LOC110479923 [Lonchura striata]